MDRIKNEFGRIWEMKKQVRKNGSDKERVRKNMENEKAGPEEWIG